jgi:hypothetical protein
MRPVGVLAGAAGLVIRSVLEHVYEHESDVVTVIPEAWEFLRSTAARR